jgi:HKD family nuclease
MLIIQNEFSPGGIQNGLFDLMRNGVASIRICSAYMSMSGSELLFDAIERSAADNDHERVTKTIVTSLDFALTQPEALRFWKDAANSRVLVAGTSLLPGRRLIPQTAFHTKFYLFDRPNGTTGSLISSANLTNRGLTVNSEVAWLQMNHAGAAELNVAWEAVIRPAVPLTDEILDAYSAIRDRIAAAHPTEELEPVPAPPVGPPALYTPFGDAGINPGVYDQMWIQSRGLQGGARTQLELPRGTHRFFGAAYRDYDFERVEHIAEPVLVAGRRRWTDRPLTWHGDNAMERINLPSQAK